MATDVGAMLDRALGEPGLAALGESLETARRLYGVGNYVYCRDLVGYLLAQHGDVQDGGLLRAIYDELAGLGGPDADGAGPPAEPGDRADVGFADAMDPGAAPVAPASRGDDGPGRRGARVVHDLEMAARPSPRSRPAGHFGGAAARDGDATPTSPPPRSLTPPPDGEVVRAIDPRPEAPPAPGPTASRVATPPEASVEVEGRPVLPGWRAPPAGDVAGPARRAAARSGAEGRRDATPATPRRPRAELVPYGGDRAAPPSPSAALSVGPQAAPAPPAVVPAPAHLAAPVIVEGSPSRIALAFLMGLLIGALAVVVLMQSYQQEVRPTFPGISARSALARYTPAPRRAPWPEGVAATQAPPGSAAPAAAPPAPVAVTPAAAAAPPEIAPTPAAPTPVAVAVLDVADVAVPSAAPPPAPAAPPPRAARPAAVPAHEGRLIVETRPPTRGRVRVRVDGADVGVAPLKITVVPGIHEIQTIQGDGYPELRMVRVDGGRVARVVVPVAGP